MTERKNKTGLLSNVRGDIFGGLTAGIVALPLALAFGVQSGLGAPAGLYGAIFIGFFASLFGGTNTQISGPTAPMTAVSMLIIAGILAEFDGNVKLATPAILTVFLLAGIFQLILGFVKSGSLIKYIPYPVVSGFMSGIGVIIIITQLLPLFGYNPSQDTNNIRHFKAQAEEVLLDKILQEEVDEGLLVLDHFEETIKRSSEITEADILNESKTLVSSDSAGVIGSLRYLPKAIQNINWLEFILALVTIFIIFGFKRITKAVPSTLVALLVVSLVVYFAQLNALKIGEIPKGFPKLNYEIFTQFSISSVMPYIFTAFSLALLGAIDSLLTSVVADNMTKTRHDSNRELFGQGIGNSIAAIFGGIPGAGATIRTVVNIDAGGKTKLSGMIAALLLLTILLALGPFASQIPKAVLAGILLTVGIGVMDYKGLKALPSMPKADAIVLILVLVLTVFWDLIFAVALGLVVSSLMFMKNISSLSAKKSKVVPLGNKIGDQLPANYKEEVFVKEIDGPLFFGSTSDFQKLSMEIPKTASDVVLNMREVPYMDKSGLNAMEDVLLGLSENNIEILVVGLDTQPRYLMESIDIIPDLVPENKIFQNMESCVAWIKENVEDKY